MPTIRSYQDIIDVRDIIETVENHDPEVDPEDNDDVNELNALLSELAGYGGDEQWRGDWYPMTLIRDSYFERYAQQLAEDIGAIPEGLSWPARCIDWERAASELQMDYTTVEYDGVTYWYR